MLCTLNSDRFDHAFESWCEQTDLSPKTIAAAESVLPRLPLAWCVPACVIRMLQYMSALDIWHIACVTAGRRSSA